MNSFRFLSTSVIDALGWTLLHALWQGFVLVLLTAVVLHFLRNQASSLRYRISVSALFSQLIASAVTFLWYYKPVAYNQPSVSTPVAHYAMQIQWRAVSQTLPWYKQTQHFLEDHLGQFVLIYLIGVGLFGLRLVGGWAYLQHVSKTSIPSQSADWIRLTNRLKSLLSIKVAIQVRESTRIVVRMVIGKMKPVLLLPIGLATALSAHEIEAILAHELAHVKRYDYAVNLLQSTMEVLYFFHPALWWLSARVREEREHCCDDLAIQITGGDGRVLAQALARIEELRLIQSSQPPVLAMAFASTRHHLLYRVRRVLGVQTRPFISNGNLVGLTLASLLLMSISVYAMQKQDKPTQTVTQPKPTRRYKVDKNTEYGVDAKHKLSYIIWRGKNLPSTRVAVLQRQLDQVMAGQLSLDSIPQSDRDILLTVIEKNYAFDAGMKALSEGMAHIDYDNIVSDALKSVPLHAGETVEGSAKVEYDSLIQGAMAAISSITAASAETTDMVSEVQRNPLASRVDPDSLIELRAINKEKKIVLQQKAQVQQFAVEAVERTIERLERQKLAVERKRFGETTRQRQLILQSGYNETDSSRATLEKRIDAGELKIKKIEAELEALDQQLIRVQSDLEKAEQPLRDTELQIRRLESSDRETYTLIDGDILTPSGTTIRPLQRIRATSRPVAVPVPPAAIRGHATTIPPLPATPNVKPRPATKPE